MSLNTRIKRLEQKAGRLPDFRVNIEARAMVRMRAQVPLRELLVFRANLGKVPGAPASIRLNSVRFDGAPLRRKEPRLLASPYSVLV
jgi:hypothetical protein